VSSSGDPVEKRPSKLDRQLSQDTMTANYPVAGIGRHSSRFDRKY